MELQVKQLKQNNQIFVPQTTAEAVLVKHGEEVRTLNVVLERKIEGIIAVAGSGLTATPNGTSVIIKHSNEITANNAVQPLQVKYDNRGHIVETAPMGTLSVVVNKQSYVEVDGSKDQTISMGDDFQIDQNEIKLNWNNL